MGEEHHSEHVTRLGRAPAAVVDTQVSGLETIDSFLASARFLVYLSAMNEFRIGQAADLLGVSTDTLRRWADAGRVHIRRTEGGHRVISGTDLAAFATELSESDDVADHRVSARNRFVGLVTRVKRDSVMAQVEIQSGPHRIVSLISTEAVDDLGLEPGVLASAVVKSTNVVIELP
jgi:molybdopterin-binding protein